MNPPKTSLIHREGLWLILVVTVGLALRIIAIAAFSHTPESDELAYQSIALNLISGIGAVDLMGNHAMYNVGYPLFVLAPVYALSGENIFIARVFNALLGGLAVVLCYVIAREAGAGKIGRLLAAALWALYLPASVYTVYLLKENLMTPLMLGVIWCALRLFKEPGYSTAAACGMLFGLLALTGNAALSLVAPVILALIFTPASLGRKLSLSVLILVAAVLVATPWMIRNTRVLGAPILNTNGGFNLYLGNNPAATGMFVSISDTPRGPTWEALRKKGEVVASETLKEEAIAWIKHNPSQFVALALKKAWLFWTPPFHQGKGQASTAESVVRVMWAIQYVALLACALGGLRVRCLRSPTMMVFWLAIASYTAVHMLFYVIFRYREPIMPLICVLAAISLQSQFDQWRHKRVGDSMPKSALHSQLESSQESANCSAQTQSPYLVDLSSRRGS